MTPGTEDHFSEYGPDICKEIEEATGGQLKINFFYIGEHPYKAGDLLKAVSDGDTQLAEVAFGYAAGVEPRPSVIELPLLIPESDFDLYKELLDAMRVGFLKDVWTDWNVQDVSDENWYGQQLYATAHLENWDSLKGLRIRAWSPVVADMIAMWNAEPVSIAWAEAYHAISTGLIDGLVTGIGPMESMGFFDIVKSVSWIDYMFPTVALLANKDALAELPADVRDILLDILEANREPGRHYRYDRIGPQMISAMYNTGVTLKAVPKPFIEEMRERSYEAVWKPWVDRSGPAGAEAFNEVAKAIIAAGYTVPGYTPH